MFVDGFWRMLAAVEVFVKNPWLVPAVFFGAGILLGMLFEYVVLPIVSRIAQKTKWEFDDIFIGSLKGIGFVWIICAGAHLAAKSMPITTTTLPTLAINSKAVKAVPVVPADINSPAAGTGKAVAEQINLVNLIDNILLVIFLATMTLLVMRIAVGFLNLYTRDKGGTTRSVTLFTNVTKVAIAIIGMLVILQALQIPITPILTALGVGGLAVALALQDTLSNLFAGLHVIASHQIKPGDYIKLEGGHEGYVTDITWRNTTIRALANNMVIVPNSKLSTAIITNCHQPDHTIGMGLEISVTWDSDLDKVEQVTNEVANEILKMPQVINTGPVEIRFGSASDNSIKFGVGFRIKEFTDQFLVKHQFLKALQKRYLAEGIQLAQPVRTVYLKSDGKSASA